MGEVTLLDGDTLVVDEGNRGRLTWYDDRGQYVRREQIDFRQVVDLPWVVGDAWLLSDRTFLLRVFERFMLQDLPQREIHRPTFGLVRHHHESGTQDTLAWFEGSEYYVVPAASEPFMRRAPFSPRTSLAWGDDAIYFADTKRYEIQARYLSPPRTVLIRRDLPGLPVTTDDRNDYRERYRTMMQEPGRDASGFERWLAEVPFPKTKPPIGRLAVDRLGNLWVEIMGEHPPGVEWAVHAPSGELIATVTVPEGLNRVTGLMDIGDDYLVGIWVDENDVETMKVYSINKP